MKKLLICVALLSDAVGASDGSFERVVGGEAFDRGVFVDPTSDGGYISVGVTESFGEGGEDVYLVRTDAAGNILWTRSFGGSGDDNGWSVHESDGHFFIAGFTDSYGAGDFDCYLIGTDSDGKAEWSRTFGGVGKDRCWGIRPTADGGYVLVGETTSFGSGAEDCYLIRTDASGDEVWSRTFGGEKGDRCFAVAQAGDGGFLLAGQTYSEGAGDRDAYLIKTDELGTQEWSRTFGGAESDVAHSVSKNAEGDFIVTGYSASLATLGDDPYVIRIDVEGEVLWTSVFAMEGVNRTLTGEQTTDGGFIMGGFSENRSSGVRSALLVKADADGELEWSRDVLPTATGRTVGYTVRATRDGGAILTGHTTEGSTGDLDLFLIKTNQLGE